MNLFTWGSLLITVCYIGLNCTKHCLYAGPAHDNPIISSKASLKYPAGIDVLIIEPGKNEIAFVCDKGNSCIRFIKSVHSFNVDKFIEKLKLISAPVNSKPEGWP